MSKLGLALLSPLLAAVVVVPPLNPLPVERFQKPPGPLAAAVLLTTPQAQGFGAVHAASDMGMPLVVTRDVLTAMRQPFMMVNGPLDALSAQSLDDLHLWLHAGGVLVVDNLHGPYALSLSGAKQIQPASGRMAMKFDTPGPDGSVLSTPLSGKLTLGMTGKLDAHVLARFDDGTAAVLDRTEGWGHVISLGVELDDALQPRMRPPGPAPFNPAGDALPYLLRSWYLGYANGTAVLDSAPSALIGTLAITHDIPTPAALQMALRCARLERASHVSATYFMNRSAVNPGTGKVLKRLAREGFDISVGGSPVKTWKDADRDRQVLCRTVASPLVETFRGGPPDDPLRWVALQKADYRNDSSFSANTIFPAIMMENAGTERESTISELPILAGGLTPPTALATLEKVGAWHGVDVLSLPPDTPGVLDIEQALLDRAKGHYNTMCLRDVGNWWRIRAMTRLCMEPRSGSWIVKLQSPITIYGLTVDFGGPRRLMSTPDAAQFDPTHVVVPALKADTPVEFSVEDAAPSTPSPTTSP